MQYQEVPGIVEGQELLFKFMNRAFIYQDADKPRILSESALYRLSFSIMLKSYAQYYKIDFKKLDEQKGDAHWVLQYPTDEITNERDKTIREKIVSFARKHHLHLVHEGGLSMKKLNYGM